MTTYTKGIKPNIFFFKLVALAIQFLTLVFIFIPILFVFLYFKGLFATEPFIGKGLISCFKLFFNGNTNYHVNHLSIIFLSIYAALPLAVLNIFAFEKYSNFELKYYLKSKQVYTDELALSLEQIKDILSKQDFYKLLSADQNQLLFKKSNILIPDIITIRKNNHEITIESKPKWKLQFIDFAQNYKNIVHVFSVLKSKI